MNKYFFINPRYSGKTSKAIYEYLKSPEDTLYVCHNKQTAKEICKSINGISKNFISCKEFETFTLWGTYINNIIFDEYLFFSNKEKVYNKFIQCIIYKIQNLYIFSTSNILYDFDLLSQIKSLKKEKVLNYDSISVLEKLYTNKIISQYLNNFLTDKDIKIIDEDWNYHFNEDLYSFYGKEEYSLFVENNWHTKKKIKTTTKYFSL